MSESTDTPIVDSVTLKLILRSRAFSYTVAAGMLVAGGVLQTTTGIVLMTFYAFMAGRAAYRIVRPGPILVWTSYVDMVIPILTAVLCGYSPTAAHSMVGAQIVGALLVPRSRVTVGLTATGATAVIAGMVFAGTPAVAPLNATGYAIAEIWTVALGLLFGIPLILILSQRNWESRQKLEAYAERERNSAEVQKRLVSVVSHELRTPLSSILGFAEVIATDDDLTNGERTEFAHTIAAEAGHLSRLVDDLVDHLKLDLDRLSVRPQPMDASEVARRLVLGNETRGREVSGERIIPRAPVIGDPDRLYQVIRNLLDNAVRYGGDHIAIGIDRFGATTEIWVHDDGAGLPPGRAEELFGEYAQAESGRGLGLGLSIARRLTEAMGGTLVYDGEAQGARFVISLPTAVVEPAMVIAPDNEGTLRSA